MKLIKFVNFKKAISEPAINIIGKSRCTGCSACAACCPNNAITIIENREGFLEPNVNNNCNNCGLCSQICPVISHGIREIYEPIIYAGWSLDKKNILQSSSGGIFYELAKEIKKEQGKIAGVIWKDNYPIHAISEKISIIKAMRGSKYLQSKTLDTFKQILENNSKKLLFVGTPCQVAAAQNLHSFFKKNYELLTCDLVCHGVPSYLIFNKYVQYVEENFGEVAKIDFRNKLKGWENYNVKINLKDGANVVEPHKSNKLMQCYLSNIGLRKSCYDCLFATFPRLGDITLGDFWDVIDLYKNFDGTSFVVANTPIGQKYLQRLRSEKKIELKEYDNQYYKRNLSTLSRGKKLIPLKRKKFLEYIKEHSFIDSFKKYTKPTLRNTKFFSFFKYLKKLLYKDYPIDITKNKSRIGLLNASSTKNYGSMMIVTNTISYLSTKIPRLTFIILGNNTPETQNRLWKSTGYKNIIIRKPLILKKNPKSIIKNIIIYLKSLVNPWSNPVVKSLGDCSSILFLGGDTLTEYYSINGPIKSLLDIRSLRMAGKKVFLLGQTIGPFHSWRTPIAKNILNKVDHIYTRSPKNYRYLKNELGLENVTSSVDSAFLDLPRQKEQLDLKKYGIDEKKRYITFVPSALWSKYSYSFKTYIDGLVFLTNKLLDICEKNDMKLIFLPHVVRKNQDDRRIAETILTYLKSPNIIFIKDVLLPYEARKILGISDLVISQRMHGAISGLQMGVPSIGLSYSVKYAGVIGESLKLPELIVEIDKKDFKGCIKSVLMTTKKVLDNMDEEKYKIDIAVKKAKKNAYKQIIEVAKALRNQIDENSQLIS